MPLDNLQVDLQMQKFAHMCFIVLWDLAFCIVGLTHFGRKLVTWDPYQNSITCFPVRNWDVKNTYAFDFISLK